MANIYNRQWATEKEGKRRRGEERRKGEGGRGPKELGSDLIEMLPLTTKDAQLQSQFSFVPSPNPFNGILVFNSYPFNGTLVSIVKMLRADIK